MKNMILFLVFAFIFPPITQAQITRGASPGEIYVSNFWYIDANYNSHSAVLYSPNNGADLLLQFESLDYSVPGEMRIGTVLGDAAPGALYNYGWNELWVSFDYGVNWAYREDYQDYIRYWGGGYEGVIFKGGWGLLQKSDDYALTFVVVADPPNCPISDVGYLDGEFSGIDGNAGEGYLLYHTFDYANTYTEIPIDSSVAFWQISGKYPEISRGTEPGELYLVSWWPDVNYKIFHSVDTGYTWTQQYESEYINLYYWGVQYTAGRQPGSFYVKRTRYDQTFTHAQVYIDYSNDYGQTFTTYFHDLDSLYTSITPINKFVFRLSAFPNPFTERTAIEFEMPENCNNPLLNIYDIKGTLIRQYNITGKEAQQWDGRNSQGNLVPGGIYLYTIKYDNVFSQFNKLLFIF